MWDIIVDETFKYIEKGTNNLVFPWRITNMYIWHNVPKLDLDKELEVKGTVIMAATWRNLTGLKPKRKGNWDVAIRETLMSLSPEIMPTFLTFLVDLFSGDFCQPACPKAHSSTPTDVIEPVSPTIEESAKIGMPIESEEVCHQDFHASRFYEYPNCV
ncbi:hypothetical protein V6N12_003705 [Hibiscus sabdariffa]|uniref:Aminotransferase-like plant mobile domain-containing protein n=1 Tax=Hibiscus sabdariffa TaxID=183260 RepID=A0ABR1ZQV9_9ROSI